MAVLVSSELIYTLSVCNKGNPGPPGPIGDNGLPGVQGKSDSAILIANSSPLHEYILLYS